MRNIIFTSTHFPVLPHEDKELNHGILGRSVADWIKDCLHDTRFAITEDVNEDFGHCLMIHRQPYWLWIGCVGASDHDYDEDGLDEKTAGAFPLASIQWTVWVRAEWGLLSWLLRRDRRASDRREILQLLKARLAALPRTAFL